MSLVYVEEGLYPSLIREGARRSCRERFCKNWRGVNVALDEVVGAEALRGGCCFVCKKYVRSM